MAGWLEGGGEGGRFTKGMGGRKGGGERGEWRVEVGRWKQARGGVGVGLLPAQLTWFEG